ncbi:hypothetical protein ES703_119647 [subsurface metagenome]
MVSKEGAPNRRKVTLGISDDTNVEVERGLEEGEMVFSSGLKKLIESRRMQREAEQRRPRMRLPLH